MSEGSKVFQLHGAVVEGAEEGGENAALSDTLQKSGMGGVESQNNNARRSWREMKRSMRERGKGDGPPSEGRTCRRIE